jgi:hypothetical protein
MPTDDVLTGAALLARWRESPDGHSNSGLFALLRSRPEMEARALYAAVTAIVKADGEQLRADAAALRDRALAHSRDREFMDLARRTVAQMMGLAPAEERWQAGKAEDAAERAAIRAIDLSGDLAPAKKG